MFLNDKFFLTDDLEFFFDLDDTLIKSIEAFLDILNTDPILSKIIIDKALSNTKLSNGQSVVFPVKEEDVSSFSFLMEIIHTDDEIKNKENLKKLFGDKNMYIHKVKPFEQSVEFIDFLKYNFGIANVKIITASPPDAEIEEAKNIFIKNTFGLEEQNVYHSGKEKKGLIINRIRKENGFIVFFDDAIHNHTEDLLNCSNTFTVGISHYHNGKGTLFPDKIDSVVDNINDAFDKFKNTYISSLINISKHISNKLRLNELDTLIKDYEIYKFNNIFFDIDNFINKLKYIKKNQSVQLKSNEDRQDLKNLVFLINKIIKFEESLNSGLIINEKKKKENKKLNRTI